MSNTGKHNDDLFRQNMEDFREMPSDKVWAGVADALDKKKKRRFIIWFWTGGLGFAASIILALFIIIPTNKNELLHTDNRIEKTVEEPIKSVIKKSNKNIDKQAENGEANQVTVTDKQTTPSQENITSNFDRANSPTKQRARDIIKNTPNTSKIASAETQNVPASTKLKDEKSERITVLPLEKEPVSNILLPTEGMQLVVHPIETYESPAIALVCASAPPRFRATIGVYGYGGGVAYQRNQPTTPQNLSPNTPATTDNKRFGLYAATTIKGGFIHRNGIYMNVGIGYETQRFVTNQQFNFPLTPTNGVTTDQQDVPSFTTSFGEVGIPFATEDLQNAVPEALKGKLLYQSHHLFFPVDLGYSFQFKRVGLDLGTSAAFHIPLSQKAIFYTEDGDSRALITNQAAAFNFSVGFESSVRYTITPRLGISAGGTFRYHILNAYQGTSSVSRPYVLSGNLGLRYIISR